MAVRRSVTLLAISAPALVAAAPETHAATIQITTCGQTVTTNAVLTKNLVCTGDGIVVGASGITIDLKGFVLRGDRSGGDFGIDDSGGYDNVKIKNGVVRNFHVGVWADGEDEDNADRVQISQLVVTGNVTDGIQAIGVSASVLSSTAAGNGGDGIFVFGESASVQSSTALGNGAIGIVVGGTRASVKSSTASGNGQEGIRVSGVAPSVVASEASANGYSGVNGYSGIRVFGPSVSIVSSTASGNAARGIDVTSESALIKSSTASANGSVGISVEGSSASVMSSRTWRNSTGISVVGDSATVKSSTASANALNGIVVAGNAATIAANRADGNGFAGATSDLVGLGIFAVGFTTAPTGTNTARGNDDPRECDPLSLC